MKRRAANVKVTKRAAPQSNNANTATGANNASGGSGQEGGSGQDKDMMGVVSLVQLERHYGFIEVCKNTPKLLVDTTQRPVAVSAFPCVIPHSHPTSGFAVGLSFEKYKLTHVGRRFFCEF